MAPISSDWGYETQKYVSPIAIKLNFNFGSIQIGLGFDVSYGMLKGGHGYRGSYGATYYWSNYGGYNGWEQRIGGEVEILPLLSYSGTTFIDGENNQTTNRITLGDPFSFMSYENDTEMPFNFFGVPKYDGSDRYRTASARISVGGLEIGLNLHTGMAGGDGYDMIGTGVKGAPRVFTGGDIDDPRKRAGVLYIGFGPIRIGANSEGIRHTFQNRLAHDQFWTYNYGEQYPWVLKLDKNPRFYWYFGTGTGNTNW
ncbi:MAG: polymorphic toxin type 23 domain-containing protein [Breznakibacter sp.]